MQGGARVEDTQIIELYWNRNQQAVSESSIKYGAMLARISFGILHSNEDSEECVNDTYLKAWDSIPPQKPGSLPAYLGRIVRNISINRWHENHTTKRSGATVMLSELSECIPSADSVQDEVEADELAAVIIIWLNSLSQDDRVLFLKRYWYSESLNSLADECATTPNKLAGRMYRLRAKLKKTLEMEGISL